MPVIWITLTFYSWNMYYMQLTKGILMVYFSMKDHFVSICLFTIEEKWKFLNMNVSEITRHIIDGVAIIMLRSLLCSLKLLTQQNNNKTYWYHTLYEIFN